MMMILMLILLFYDNVLLTEQVKMQEESIN